MCENPIIQITQVGIGRYKFTRKNGSRYHYSSLRRTKAILSCLESGKYEMTGTISEAKIVKKETSDAPI